MIFEKRSRIAAPPERVWAFHEAPDAFERLTPPWEDTKVVEKSRGLGVGARTVVDTKVGPFTQRLVAVHTACEPGRMFRDEMVSGPFARWAHTHSMTSDGEGGTWLVDHIEYELPLGVLGRLGGGWFVRRKLERMFTYRHRVTREACEP